MEHETAKRNLDSPLSQANRAGGDNAAGPCATISGGNGIGWAVKQLWNGGQVRRRGWNGRGMHLALQVPDMHSKMNLPYVYMKTAYGQLVPWLCSQTDLLSFDWELAEV